MELFKLSDFGKQFISKLPDHVNQYLGVKKDFTTAYYLQNDDLVDTLIDQSWRQTIGIPERPSVGSVTTGPTEVEKEQG